MLAATDLDLLKRLCSNPLLTEEEAAVGVVLADEDDTELEEGDDEEPSTDRSDARPTT